MTLQIAANAPMGSTQRIPLPQGDAGTETTIQKMWQLIDAGMADQNVNRTAMLIVRGVPQFNRLAEAQAVYRWVRANLRFTSDIRGKETLRSPAEILQVKGGDCDDYVILTCALLGTIGHKMRIVTVASHPADPTAFTHVYPEDFIRGQWIALDAARRNPALGKSPRFFTRKRAWYNGGEYEDLEASSPLLGQRGIPNAPAVPAGDGGAFGDLDGFLGQDFNWAQLPADITAATSGAANIIRATNAPNIPYYGPGGVPVAAAAAPSMSMSSMMPFLLIGGLLLTVVAMKD
jgi:hypothetical protein